MTPTQIQTFIPRDLATSAEWEESLSSSDETVVHDSDDTSADEDLRTPDEVRCKYPSKFCGRPRAHKADGTIHRLCQYHRNKANTNQKRWTSVRRKQAAQQRRMQEMLQHGYQPTASMPGVGNGPWMEEFLPDPVRHEPRAAPIELPWEDVRILQALLMNEPPSPSTHSQQMTPWPFRPVTDSSISRPECYVHNSI